MVLFLWQLSVHQQNVKCERGFMMQVGEEEEERLGQKIDLFAGET